MKPLIYLFILTTVILTGCQYRNIVNVKNGTQMFANRIQTCSTFKGNIKKGLTDSDYKMVGDFATMSSYVYSCKVDSVSMRPLYNGIDCRECYESSEKAEFEYLRNRWKRFDTTIPFPNTPKKKRRVPGFSYDVWINTNNDLAVIVFRGTDFTDWGGDWFSNFHWVTKFACKRWDQYQQVDAIVPLLIKELTNKYGNGIKVFATGHSLGGGLAQHAGYKSKQISKIFAFDPSPVTAFYDIPKSERKENKKGKVIYRVYEKGEVLSFLRTPLSAFYWLSKKNPVIVQLRYNMLLGNIVNEHSITRFAEALRQDIELLKKR